MDGHIGFINTSVHILMYTYYFLSSFKELHWLTNKSKPFITAIQLVQLVVIFGQAAAALSPSCPSSKLFHLMMANAAILIYFFGEFYVKSYLNKKKV